MSPLVGLAVVAALSLCQARAAEPSTGPRITGVEIGFGGVYKVGHWTPVWVTLEGGTEDVRGRVELTTPDGDGVRATFLLADATPIRVPAGDRVSVLRYVKFGRTRADLTVHLVADGRERVSRRFTSSRLPAPLVSTRELILVLGRPIGLEQAIHRRLRREAHRMTICRIEAAEHLPRQWQGYEAVNTVVVTTSELSILEQMDDDQFAAFDQWLQLGGRLILCVGRRGEQVFGPANRLARFSPGRDPEVVFQRNTSGLENYAGATERLDSAGGKRVRRFSVPMTALTEVRGRIASSELGGPAGRLPTIVRFPYGLGRIVLVAFDLDQPPFTVWQGRAGLVAKILRGDRYQPRDDDSMRGPLGQGARLGYDDLVGQLRAALDQFQGVTRARFSWIAGLISVYILLVGPADYFLLRKLGRMHWTWVTMPLVVIGFCAVAVALANGLSGKRVHVNQVELVDVDIEESWVRGTTWAHVYSPAMQTFRLSLDFRVPAPRIARGAGGQLLTWQGLPGDGLGGLNTTATAALFAKPYTISYFAAPSADKRPEIAGVPIQVSGSKSLLARWWTQVDLGPAQTLSTDRNGLLSGRMVNPLDIELTDCMVMYENWAYPISGVVGPGAGITFDGLTPRNLEWRLTRRRVVQTKDVGTPWDPTSLDVPRIMEMMMCYEAAGGRSYTGLTHRYQPYVDLSEHLRTGRAILVGRAAAPASQLMREGRSLADDCDRHWTFYRLVFPVRKQEGNPR